MGGRRGKANGGVGTAPRAVLGASILRSRVSAIGYLVQVFGFGYRYGEIDCPTANR